MQKVLVGFPLYHQVPANWFTRWESLDRTHLAGTVVINGAYIITAMNMMADLALKHEGDWDRLLVYEHDMMPPTNAITRVAHHGDEHDIVGCMYFSHTPPHFAFAYIEYEDGVTDPLSASTVQAWCDKPGLYPVSSVGFGLTSISRRVLENWDSSIPMFAQDKRWGSHDLWFCKKARDQGFKVFVDSGLVCGHLSQMSVGLTHNQAHAHTATGTVREFSMQ